MSRKFSYLLRLSIPLLMGVAGCEGPPEDEAVGEVSSALSATNGLAFNGLAFNGMSFNGLAFNGLAFNGLAFNGLAFNGMAYNGLAFNGLSDPVVHDFVAYLVGCALPENDSVSFKIDGTSYTFAGDIGLAPEWKQQSCGAKCQGWVSACMLSRLNKKGEHIQISMRGESPALALDSGELRDFRTREGSYYGNLFAKDQPIYACYSPGTPQLLRVCGDSLAGCPMHVVGPCDRACDDVGKTGYFKDCGPTTHSKKSDDISEVITIFLR
jgi:hypothetical protein